MKKPFWCKLGFHSWINYGWYRIGVEEVGFYVNNELIGTDTFKEGPMPFPRRVCKKCIFAQEKVIHMTTNAYTPRDYWREINPLKCSTMQYLIKQVSLK